MPKRATDARDVAKFDLKAAREARSLSQVATAELLMATQSSVSRWEIDGTIPAIYKAYWDLYWSVKDNEQAQQKPEPTKEKVAAKCKDKPRSALHVGGSKRVNKEPRRGTNS
jgi:transcriptional regulator with XRE-family HTH domain